MKDIKKNSGNGSQLEHWGLVLKQPVGVFCTLRCKRKEKTRKCASLVCCGEKVGCQNNCLGVVNCCLPAIMKSRISVVVSSLIDMNTGSGVVLLDG